MTYSGPERRRANDLGTRLGVWLLERAGFLAGAIVLMFAMLAVLAFGIVQSNHRADEQLSKLELLVSAQQAAGAQGRDVIRCILAELTAQRLNTAGAVDAIGAALGLGDLPPLDGAATVGSAGKVPDPEEACRNVDKTYAGTDPAPVPGVTTTTEKGGKKR